MIETLRRLIMGLAMVGMLGGCPGPNPPTPPTPTPPPVDPVVAKEMLLTTSDAKIFKGSEQVQAFMAVQCCMTPPAEVGNSRWPLASESWMDYTRPYGANFYHFRLGPFFGDANHESEWADVGGAYVSKCAEGRCEFNQPFFDKVKSLLKYAADHSAWVEVNVIDTWYCKHAQWGDQEMPWPNDDIQACGKYGSPEQERFIRKVVSELGCYGNVIWLLDNEGSQVDGNQETWFAWERDIIRDEEAKSGCGLRHLIGTNTPDYGEVGDYVATHSKQPLLEPLSGRWTVNNERNPSASPEQEAYNFAKARESGLAWAFWRAEMEEGAMVETLSRMRDIVQGGNTVGCFPPDDENDANWQKVEAADRPCQMCGAVNEVKDRVGDRCGQDPSASLDILAAELRKMGYCAGHSSDQVSLLAPDGLWEEQHIIAYTDGCYTLTSRGYKGAWKYLGGQ